MARRLTTELRAELLERLTFDHGHVGEVDARREEPHFPVREHLRALEADMVFVLGPRGAGKSSLARSIADPTQRKALARFAGVAIPRGKWLKGYDYGSRGPSPRAWEEFSKQDGREAEPLQMVWFGLLVRCLIDEFDPEERVALAPILKPQITPGDLHDATRGLASKAELACDALESRLRREERSLFVTYDELDTLFYTRWSSMMRVIQALMALWAGYYRRWRFIRAKFFLRTDLFEESARLMTSDIAKMAARRVDLHWSERSLYGALFQHILNKDEALREYFEGVLSVRRLEGLGFVPTVEREETIKPAVRKLCGENMGAGSNKGHTVSWLINSVRDGAGRVSPRNLVRLVEHAAVIERHRPRAGKKPQLLHHVSLRNALTRVSEEQVRESISSEYPWLSGLSERLKEGLGGQEVPWARKELESYLSLRWADPWTAHSERERPPAQDPSELVDRLLRLGIFRERRPRERTLVKNRSELVVDVPDLYLEGLGLKRRGGVARK